MKKVIPLLCAVTIAGSSIATFAAQADGLEETVVVSEEEQVSNEVDEAAEVDGDQEDQVGFEEVTELTLEDVISRGIENDRNLKVLQFNLEATNNQLLDTTYDKKDLERDIKKLKDKIDDLKDEKDGLEGAAKSMNFQERKGAMDSLETLEDSIQSLETAIEQLQTGQLVPLQLQQEEAKEGVRLMLTSAYINILSLQEQMDLTQKVLESAKKDVYKAEQMYNVGLGSSEDIRKAKVSQTNTEKQLEELEKNYNHTVADLSFDIGVSYNPEMVIQPIQFEAATVTKPEDYRTLIDNTFKVKRAEKSLESAIIGRDHAYREYEEDDKVGEDVSIYELAQHDAKVEAAKETLVQTKEDIETSIEQLYYDAEIANFNYEEGLRKLEDAKRDVAVLETQYKVGLVSKFDYESALIQLDQAELAVYTASVQNFIIQEKIKAFENGYI